MFTSVVSRHETKRNCLVDRNKSHGPKEQECNIPLGLRREGRKADRKESTKMNDTEKAEGILVGGAMMTIDLEAQNFLFAKSEHTCDAPRMER